LRATAELSVHDPSSPVPDLFVEWLDQLAAELGAVAGAPVDRRGPRLLAVAGGMVVELQQPQLAPQRPDGEAEDRPPPDKEG
jgi:hypothetical protein